MVQRLHYVLVSPEKKLVDEYVLNVLLPAFEGQLQVFPGHSPLLSFLTAGFVILETSQGKQSYFVTGGYADISEKTVTLLAEEAVPAEDLTIDYLKKLVEKEKLVLSQTNDLEAQDSLRAQLVALEQILKNKTH
jgi:F-type H+-transporting ATPase subunit epsilon